MPVLKCHRCGKEEYVGCDDVAGRKVTVWYAICEDCRREIMEKIAKILEEQFGEEGKREAERLRRSMDDD